MCLLYYIILHYIILHYIILYHIILHYITLYYIILYYIILYYIILYYITLHYIIFIFILYYRKTQWDGFYQALAGQAKSIYLYKNKDRIFNNSDINYYICCVFDGINYYIIAKHSGMAPIKDT